MIRKQSDASQVSENARRHSSSHKKYFLNINRFEVVHPKLGGQSYLRVIAKDSQKEWESEPFRKILKKPWSVQVNERELVLVLISEPPNGQAPGQMKEVAGTVLQSEEGHHQLVIRAPRNPNISICKGEYFLTPIVDSSNKPQNYNTQSHSCIFKSMMDPNSQKLKTKQTDQSAEKIGYSLKESYSESEEKSEQMAKPMEQNNLHCFGESQIENKVQEQNDKSKEEIKNLNDMMSNCKEKTETEYQYYSRYIDNSIFQAEQTTEKKPNKNKTEIIEEASMEEKDAELTTQEKWYRKHFGQKDSIKNRSTKLPILAHIEDHQLNSDNIKTITYDDSQQDSNNEKSEGNHDFQNIRQFSNIRSDRKLTQISFDTLEDGKQKRRCKIVREINKPSSEWNTIVDLPLKGAVIIKGKTENGSNLVACLGRDEQRKGFCSLFDDQGNIHGNVYFKCKLLSVCMAQTHEMLDLISEKSGQSSRRGTDPFQKSEVVGWEPEDSPHHSQSWVQEQNEQFERHPSPIIELQSKQSKSLSKIQEVKEENSKINQENNSDEQLEKEEMKSNKKIEDLTIKITNSRQFDEKGQPPEPASRLNLSSKDSDEKEKKVQLQDSQPISNRQRAQSMPKRQLDQNRSSFHARKFTEMDIRDQDQYQYSEPMRESSDQELTSKEQQKQNNQLFKLQMVTVETPRTGRKSHEKDHNSPFEESIVTPYTNNHPINLKINLKISSITVTLKKPVFLCRFVKISVPEKHPYITETNKQMKSHFWRGQAYFFENISRLSHLTIQLYIDEYSQKEKVYQVGRCKININKLAFDSGQNFVHSYADYLIDPLSHQRIGEMVLNYEIIEKRSKSLVAIQKIKKNHYTHGSYVREEQERYNPTVMVNRLSVFSDRKSGQSVSVLTPHKKKKKTLRYSTQHSKETHSIHSSNYHGGYSSIGKNNLGLLESMLKKSSSKPPLKKKYQGGNIIIGKASRFKHLYSLKEEPGPGSYESGSMFDRHITQN